MITSVIKDPKEILLILEHLLKEITHIKIGKESQDQDQKVLENLPLLEMRLEDLVGDLDLAVHAKKRSRDLYQKVRK